MIEKIALKFGSNNSKEKLEFSPRCINIIVGPNYSGKSKFIREIQSRIIHGHKTSDDVILDEIYYKSFDKQAVDLMISSVMQKPNPGEYVSQGNIIVGNLGNRNQVNLENLQSALLNISTSPSDHHFRNWAGQWYFSMKVRLLDGTGRMALTNEQPFGDLISHPTTTLQKLFRDDDLRKEIRKIVYDAFGLYLVVDPTNAGTLRLRLSKIPPQDLEEEQSLTQRSAKFHNNSVLLNHASDGTKAFIGIITEIMAGNPEMILLDEPEAFLHPGLSYKLGHEMASQALKAERTVFVSTHSPNFLMGCVASGAPINVIRLTYKDEKSTAKIIKSEDISKLMKNPLLRSTNVLNGIFFDSVILTEGDSDRAFYQEINNRLLKSQRGIKNTLFVNSNGKDAIPTMMSLLKSLGIPVAAIYDLDFIKEGGQSATKRLSASGVPESLHISINQARSAIKSIFESKGVNYKKCGGEKLLSEDELKAFDAYANQLETFGIFLVRLGELESWLPNLGASGHASDWLIPMFEKMGDEGSASYLAPADGDVWEFLDRIAQYLTK